MDPITTAIVTAIATTLGNDVVKDSYNALKAALKKKFGEKSDLVDAVNKLEKMPDRGDRKNTVQTEVEIAKANDDPALVQLAQDLLGKLKEQPGGQQSVNQTIQSAKNSAISATGNASIGSITEQGVSGDK